MVALRDIENELHAAFGIPLRSSSTQRNADSGTWPPGATVNGATPSSSGNQDAAGLERVPFGRAMRAVHFSHAPTYMPLNHGSYGTYPRSVGAARAAYLADYEARPDVYKRFEYPALLDEARAAVAPLLGAGRDEVVFVENATTGLNTVLRNFVYRDDDVVLYFSTIYAAIEKTLWSLEETTPLGTHRIPLVYPVEKAQILAKFRDAVRELKGQGKRIRLAIFDTIISGPGVRMPWEELTAACKENGILSLIDGAHGIGHIDLTHLATVSPDFFVTNCHK